MLCILDSCILEKALTLGKTNVSKWVFRELSKHSGVFLKSFKTFIHFHDNNGKETQKTINFEEEPKCFDPRLNSETIVNEGALLFFFTLWLFVNSSLSAVTLDIRNSKFLAHIFSKWRALVLGSFGSFNDIVQAFVDLIELLAHFHEIFRFLITWAESKAYAEPWECLVPRRVAQGVQFNDL